MDSALGVNWIKKKVPPLWKAFLVLSHIWDSLSKWDEILITHVWREANRVVDFIAWISSSSELMGCSMVYPDPSSILVELSMILKEDKEGKLYSCISP